MNYGEKIPPSPDSSGEADLAFCLLRVGFWMCNVELHCVALDLFNDTGCMDIWI